MERVQKTVCELIREAAFEDENAPMGLVDVAPEDWTAVFAEFESQAVCAMPAAILPAYEDAMPEDVRQLWKGALVAELSRFKALQMEQARILMMLAQPGIAVLVLKGTSAAMAYPMPWVRSMGDIDLLVRPEQFDAARDVLLSDGYRIVDGDEADQRHVAFARDAYRVELHRRFSIAPGARGEALDALLRESLAHPAAGEISGRVFPAPQPVANGAVMLTHVVSHLATGLGLRQIIDWLMYARAELHDAQWPDFADVVAPMGLLPLAKHLTRLGQLHFGMPETDMTWCRDADARVCEALLECVFDSGNFGVKGVHEQAVTGAMANLRGHFFRTLQERGENNWELLKEHPGLRPLAWLYQLGRYLRRGLKDEDGVAHVTRGVEKSKRLAMVLRALDLEG